MSTNTFLTDDKIVWSGLDIFENALVGAKVARNVSNLFGKSGGSNRGQTVRVRKPNQYDVTTGRVATFQDINDEYVSMTVSTQYHIATSITSAEMALSVSDFTEQVIAPAVVKLANKVDNAFLAYVYKRSGLQCGTVGTSPNALATYLDAAAILDENACPRDSGRQLIIGPRTNASSIDALKGLFNSQEKLGKQYTGGELLPAVGFAKVGMDQNTPVHTYGTQGGTPLVNGATQTGATLVTDGWTASAAVRLKAGDNFTLPLVYRVNPVSKASTGVLQQFVVLSDASSDGSGNSTLSIYPPIVTSGAQQTVTVSPADNAALTILGTTAQVGAMNLAIHKQAAAIAFVPLEMPHGVHQGAVKSDDQLGVSMRFARWWDGDNDLWKARFDVYTGWEVLRPEWLVRVAGGAGA